VEEAETFLHKIKNMPMGSRIRLFNEGIINEAAESMVKKLGKGTVRSAATSLRKALGIGARRIPRGIAVALTVAEFAYYADDALEHGWKKALDNYVRDTGREADEMVTDAVRIWEKGTIQHYAKKLVELCDVFRFW
jgi:hypothetical protein